VCLEVLNIHDLVVFVALPYQVVLPSGLHDVTLDEAHFDESEDRSFDQVQIDHLVVTVASDLIQNGAAETVSDLGEAVVSKEEEGCSC